MFERFQFKPLVFKAQSAPNSTASSPSTPTTTPAWGNQRSFDWVMRRRTSTQTGAESSPESASSVVARSSPVTNIIDDFKRELELALRLRDVYILEEESGFSFLQVSPSQ